jgi:quercetin dioxygenase-like cupin family protein
MRALSPLFSAIFAIALSTAAQAQEAQVAEEADRPKLETLLTQDLEGAEGVEVVISRVTLPPDTVLPQHWHPGEEFAYVLKGTVTLYLEGEQGQILSPGEAGVVPLEKVHHAKAGEDGVALLVFRVHQAGESERVLVNE